VNVICRSYSWLAPRPSRGFVPAADLLFAPPKSRQKALPCKTAPAGSPAMLETQGSRRTHFATLRSDNCAKSVVEACFARASGFCASRRFRRGGPQTAEYNSQARTPAGGCIPLTPFSPAEQRKDLKPRAQRASRTDSAQLFEQSVAARVLRGASSPEQRREPRSAAQGRGGRGELFAYFLAGQKVGRPPGRNPGTTLGTKPEQQSQQPQQRSV
jgi:hypothetical protein